ncbi:DMT(drug/metabolite transporter) superfamily permease [Halovivax ruber XH-70]|uniref:DMT(Drug/metabolite transporter) superfamily permease n=1 Tax=Halovivax ruber (strain DSM 18193 / JCM 13892 / XH-70) TaxID=797302 RepID=L0ICQ2_HALRX|nr:DMT(drug/metabolite transporter) superfamily permease [Halovivax ruber XH-70]
MRCDSKQLRTDTPSVFVVSQYRTTTLFLVLAFAWGSAFVAIDAGLTYLPPVLFAAVRYDVAGVIMLAYALVVADDPLPRGRQAWLTVGAGAVLMIAVYHAFLFVGQLNTTAAAAAVLVSLSPVLTTGFARALVPQDALSRIGVVGVGLGLVGVLVISRPDPSNVVTTDTVANLLVFGAAAAFALGSVLTRRLDADLEIEAMEAWSMLGGAVILHVLSVGLGESFAIADWAHLEAIGALAYLSIFSSAIGFLIYFDLLDRLGAVEINMVSYVAPIVAAVVGWFYLDQPVDAATVVGFVFIFCGFLLVKRRAITRELAKLRA